MAYVTNLCGLHAPVLRLFIAFAMITAACRSGVVEDFCEAVASALRVPGGIDDSGDESRARSGHPSSD